MATYDQTLETLSQKYLANRALNEARVALRGYDVTPTQLLVLHHVVGSTSLGEIATKIGFTRANMTNISKQLEKRGFVKRTAVKDDERAKRLVLTTKGEKLLSELRGV